MVRKEKQNSQTFSSYFMNMVDKIKTPLKSFCLPLNMELYVSLLVGMFWFWGVVLVIYLVLSLYYLDMVLFHVFGIQVY